MISVFMYKIRFGGFPWWLLSNDVTINLRTNDPVYMSAVNRWYGVLFPLIKPLLYSNNGPIITIQVI